jgi:hypothetical protein
MESTQNNILKKMKGLRSIQMESELSERWGQQLGDLDTIIEDSEIFLETVVDTQRTMNKIFFGDSTVVSQNDSRPTQVDAKELDQYHEAIERLSTKLEKVNFGNFDTSDLQEMDKQINDSDNPVDVALLILDAFEQRIVDLKNNLDLLKMENGRKLVDLIVRGVEQEGGQERRAIEGFAGAVSTKDCRIRRDPEQCLVPEQEDLEEEERRHPSNQTELQEEDEGELAENAQEPREVQPHVFGRQE